jgi:glycosyltransferase 2 family protein
VKGLSWKKALSLTLRLLFVAVILHFAVTSISMNPRDIGRYLLHTGLLFYASLILFTFFLALQAAIWVKILNDSGRLLSLRKGLLVYTNSQFAKYIPGGFWNYAGRIVLGSREGVCVNIQITSIFYENILLVLAAAIYTLFLLLYLNVIPFYVLPLFGAALVLAYIYFQKISDWVGEAGGWAVRRFKFLLKLKRLSGPAIYLSRKSFFLYLGYFLLSHLIMGISFWLLIRSFHKENISILYAAGTFAASWLLGLVSPLPGGIGVREGFLVYFLSFRMDAQTALQISVIARIWNIMSEMLFFVVMNAFEFTRKRLKPYEA